MLSVSSCVEHRIFISMELESVSLWRSGQKSGDTMMCSIYNHVCIIMYVFMKFTGIYDALRV